MQLDTGVTHRFDPTAMQVGMLLESRRIPSVNVEQVICHVPTALERRPVETAWRVLSGHHAILRATFQRSAHGYTMLIHDGIELSCKVLNWSSRDSLEVHEDLQLWLADDRGRGFDSASPLWRVTVFDMPDGAGCCVFTCHHAILDGRSFRTIITEFFDAYDALCSDKSPAVDTVPDYRDYLRWMRGRDVPVAGAEYFCEYLSGVEESALPVVLFGAVGGEDGAVSATRHAEHVFEVDAERVKALVAVAEASGSTLNNVMQAAWGLLMLRYSGRTDIVFGATRAGRHGTVAGAQNMSGTFINTLPVRIQVGNDTTLSELLLGLRAHHVATRPYERMSISEIQAVSEVPAGQALFSTLLMFDTEYLDSALRAQGAVWAKRRFELREESGFELACAAYLDGHQDLESGESGRLVIKLEFDVERYDPVSIDLMASQLDKTLQRIQGGGSQLALAVSELCERQSRMIEGFDARSGAEVGGGGAAPSFVEAFEARVGLQPEQCACRFRDASLTYQELSNRSAIVARQLRAAGVGAEDIVAICLPKGLRLIETMIGVLRAGAAYLPLDFEDPSGRLRGLVQDSGARLVLTLSELQPRFDRVTVPVLRIDGSWSEVSSDALPLARGKHAAYVIYTSGTTGKPKGVVVEHRQLAHHCREVARLFSIEPGTVMLQFAAATFDVSVEDIFGTLAAGGTLVLRTPEMMGGALAFFESIDRNIIQVVNLPTAFWVALVDEAEAGNLRWPACLKTVVVGGERVSTQAFVRFAAQQEQSVQFVNGYGPTEATVTSTALVLNTRDAMPQGWASQETVPIGRPLPGVGHFVLDDRMRMVPLGVTGELFISGPGVARGYLHCPELTVERFVKLESGERAYATGDLVRLDRQGLFHFVGRGDRQVKIRGFRIELEEVECAISALEQVSAAVVQLADGAGSARLVAHVQVGDSVVEGSAIREELARSLPGYMVPSVVITHKAFPTNAAGKVARDELRVPDLGRLASQDQGPHRGVAKDLARIWCGLLGVSEVAAHDSFFELGGHSLLAVRMFSAVELLTHRRVDVRAFFGNPTIAHLADECGCDDEEFAFRRSTRLSGFASESAELAGMVPLQKEGDGLPLFLVCGIELYRDLARQLGALQPTFGVFLPFEAELAVRLDNGDTEVEFPGVAELAASYVQGIRAQQPFGPYRIGGVSFGGVLAYEAAQQLRRDGEEVDLLLLIESFLPSAWSFSRGRWLAENAASLGEASIAGTLKRCVGFSRSKWAAMKSGSMASRRISSNSGVRGGSSDDEFLHALLKGDKSGFAAMRMRVYHDAAHAYVPNIQPYDGDAVLIRATQQPRMPGYQLDPTYGWGTWIKGQLSTHDIEGDHLGVLRQPQVSTLASALIPYLRHLRQSFTELQERYKL